MCYFMDALYVRLFNTDVNDGMDYFVPVQERFEQMN